MSVNTYGGNINKKKVRDENVGVLAPIPLKNNIKNTINNCFKIYQHKEIHTFQILGYHTY